MKGAKMNIVIVEDDSNFIKIINDKLNFLISDDDQIFFCSEPEDYIKLLDSSVLLDLVIMDIELGNKSGIDLALKTNTSSPYTQIIYLTSYLQYVSDVYRSEHIFFIHKDHIDDYLPVAIKKAAIEINKIHNTLLTVYWNKVKTDIIMKDITYIERNKRTSIIHTNENDFKTAKSIDKLINELSVDFIIVHKSYIVNMNYIKTINSSDILMNNGTFIPLSRSHQNMVKTRFTDYLIKH